MSVIAAPIANVATAIRHDLDQIAKFDTKFLNLVNLKFDSKNFLVDYNANQFKLDDSAWKHFTLPYQVPVETLQGQLTDFLTKTTRELGEGKMERDLLFKGGAFTLESMTQRLALEGTGSVAALAIEDIMKAAVESAVIKFSEDLEKNHTLWRTMVDAWHALVRLAVAFVYGKEYDTRVRRERLAAVAPWVGLPIGILGLFMGKVA